MAAAKRKLIAPFKTADLPLYVVPKRRIAHVAYQDVQRADIADKNAR